jgi:phosphoglycerate dehydrogenase-like enzyme
VRLLFCGSGWLPIVDAIRQDLPDGCEIHIWDRAQPLAEALAGVQVILPSNHRIDAAAIAAAPELRLIQQPAAGIDAIDLAAARARDVPVCNAPGANRVAVAETVFLLALSLARRLPEAQSGFAQRTIGVPLGRELREMTLGIIGLGRSGSAVAEIAAGFGMDVVSIGSTSTADEAAALYRRSDVITIHCPLNDQTRGLIGGDQLAKMKPGVLLINCARGPIVDRSALEEALDSGHVRGLGIDTYWQEPWDPTDPLWSRPNVIALPHIAGSTEESFRRIAGIVCSNIRLILEGKAPKYVVN